MAFQTYQPYGKKRKTQTTTGANMKQEGSQVTKGPSQATPPNPITTQGPIQGNESAAKMAAAQQVMNKPIPAAPQPQGGTMNPIGMGMGGPQLPQGGQPAPAFNPGSMADMKNTGGEDMTPNAGVDITQVIDMITSGNIGQPLEVITPNPGTDLRGILDEIMSRDAGDEANKLAGDLLRQQRSTMGRGLTGGTAARQSDTFIDAVDQITERTNREKLDAASRLSDLDRWQAGFDRQGGQLDKEDERYDKSRLMEAMALKEDLGLNDDEFKNLLVQMGLDPEMGSVFMGGGDDDDGDPDPLEEEEGGGEEVVEEEEEFRFTESNIPDWVSAILDTIALPLSAAGIGPSMGLRIIELAINGEIENRQDFGAAVVDAYGEGLAPMIVGGLWEIAQGMMGGEAEE